MIYKVSLKPGVRIREINEGTTLFFDMLLEATEYISADMVVTSMADGIHREGSEHFKGHAGDIRARHLTYADICRLMEFLTENPINNIPFRLVQFEWRFRLNRNAQWVRAKTNLYKPSWHKVIHEYTTCKHKKVCHIHVEF